MCPTTWRLYAACVLVVLTEPNPTCLTPPSATGVVPHGESHASHQPHPRGATSGCRGDLASLPEVDAGPEPAASSDSSAGGVEREGGQSCGVKSQVVLVRTVCCTTIPLLFPAKRKRHRLHVEVTDKEGRP